jgi:hypothetical protein
VEVSAWRNRQGWRGWDAQKFAVSHSVTTLQMKTPAQFHRSQTIIHIPRKIVLDRFVLGFILGYATPPSGRESALLKLHYCDLKKESARENFRQITSGCLGAGALVSLRQREFR